jgi:hypothetical protein
MSEFINDKSKRGKDCSDFVELYFQFFIIFKFSEEITPKSCIEYNNMKSTLQIIQIYFLNRLGKVQQQICNTTYDYIIESDILVSRLYPIDRSI